MNNDINFYGNIELYIDDRDVYKVRKDDLTVLDTEWISDIFMIKPEQLDEVVKDARFWTTAEMKVTDTSLGGNTSINNLPQFTRYTDPRVKGLRKDRADVKVNHVTGNIGMGRYYSEKIDDNYIRCFMEFGVPEFNGVFSFLTSAVDYKEAVIANSARSPVPYMVGHLAGSIAMFAAFPIASTLIWLGSYAKDLLIGPGNFDFYYMKPAMFKYWSVVNSLVIMMATELGILVPYFESNTNDNIIGTPVKFDKDDLNFLKQYMPNLITDENNIDIMAVVTKTQRAINQYLDKSYTEILQENSLGSLHELIEKSRNIDIPTPTTETSFWKKMKDLLTGSYFYDSNSSNNNNENKPETSKDKTPKKISANDDGTYNKGDLHFKQNEQGPASNFFEIAKATAYEGAQYAVFNVEYLGSSTTSFSNQTGELELEGILKGVGSKARSVKFNLGGGEIIPGLQTMLNAAKDTAVGLLDGATFNVTGKILTLLLGDGNVSLPLRWMDSSISLPSHTFKMKLVSPYGNPISQLINIYIPLASIMAGALPLATGRRSYTSPFLCSMFIRGYQSIKLGMITSLNITKGTTNLAFNKSRKPLGVEVEFSVTDFSQVVALPVGHDLVSSSNIIMDDESPLNRFIQSLCGRDLYTTTYLFPKAKLRISREIQESSMVTKPSYWGMRIGEIFRPLSTLIPGATRYENYSEAY